MEQFDKLINPPIVLFCLELETDIMAFNGSYNGELNTEINGNQKVICFEFLKKNDFLEEAFPAA